MIRAIGEGLLWAVTLTSLVLAGSARYLAPQLSKSWWAAYALASLLLIFALWTLVTTRPWRANTVTGPVRWLLAGLLCAVIGTALSGHRSWPILAALKSLVPFAGVWAFLAVARLPRAALARWLMLLLIIGATQWIPMLLQYLIFRSARLELEPTRVWASDVVVGTFGGTPTSGGLSAVAAFFVVGCILSLLGLWREQLLSGRRAALIVTALGLAILLPEVKVVFFYLAAGLVVLFYDVAWARPRRFLVGAALAVALLGAGLVSYYPLHWSVAGKSFIPTVAGQLGYSFSTKTPEPIARVHAPLETTAAPSAPPARASTKSITRVGALRFWWRQQVDAPSWRTLFGHGLGASRAQGMFTGHIAQRYLPLKIDRTGMAMVLWEVGVIGLLCLLGLFVSLYRDLWISRRATALAPWQRGLAAGLHAVSPLLLLSLLYRNDIPYAAPMMFTVMTIFGLAAWLRRERGDQEN